MLFFFMLISFSKRIQTCLALYEKVNLTAGSTTSRSKNCNQVFAITGNESFILVWKNFSLLFFADMFEFSHIALFEVMSIHFYMF